MTISRQLLDALTPTPNTDKCVMLGDCVHILDDGGLEGYGITDATELAQAIENSAQISFDEFTANCTLEPDQAPAKLYAEDNGCVEFCEISPDLFFAYDVDNDVHYFYGR